MHGATVKKKKQLHFNEFIFLLYLSFAIVQSNTIVRVKNVFSSEERFRFLFLYSPSRNNELMTIP